MNKEKYRYISYREEGKMNLQYIKITVIDNGEKERKGKISLENLIEETCVAAQEANLELEIDGIYLSHLPIDIKEIMENITYSQLREMLIMYKKEEIKQLKQEEKFFQEEINSNVNEKHTKWCRKLLKGVEKERRKVKKELDSLQ